MKLKHSAAFVQDEVLLGEIPVPWTKTIHPAVLVMNISWDMTVGSCTHHLHTHAHISSTGN